MEWVQRLTAAENRLLWGVVPWGRVVQGPSSPSVDGLATLEWQRHHVLGEAMWNASAWFAQAEGFPGTRNLQCERLCSAGNTRVVGHL